MPVKSLFDLATTACLKNIRELDTVGDYLPYQNVRHILLRIDNAAQLRQIELNSPQIEGETGEIWLKIIEREFPMEAKSKAYKPQNPKKWYRVWEKYKKDHDQALEESEKKLMNALAGLKENKEKKTSRIVDRKLLPRAGHVGPIGAKRGWGQRDSAGNTMTFNRGSRTKTANGASVMRKVRREVKEIANIHGSLSRVAPKGSASLTKLRKAPPGIVNARRIAAQPAFRPTPKEDLRSAAVEEYEERATFLSDSEEEEGGHLQDLFDAYEDEVEDEESSAPSPARKTVSKPSTSTLSKRPTSSSAASPPKPTVKRSGILSNSYKPPASRPPTKPLPSNTATSSKPRQAAESSRSESRSESTKATNVLPRTQNSPPPRSSSPPEQGPAASMQAVVRKRKAVNIFMGRKKRA